MSERENALYAETTSLVDYDFRHPDEFFIEYYDLRHNYDPHQLHNLADKTSPEHLADLRSRLAAAWGCAGATCP